MALNFSQQLDSYSRKSRLYHSSSTHHPSKSHQLMSPLSLPLLHDSWVLRFEVFCKYFKWLLILAFWRKTCTKYIYWEGLVLITSRLPLLLQKRLPWSNHCCTGLSKIGYHVQYVNRTFRLAKHTIQFLQRQCRVNKGFSLSEEHFWRAPPCSSATGALSVLCSSNDSFTFSEELESKFQLSSSPSYLLAQRHPRQGASEQLNSFRVYSQTLSVKYYYFQIQHSYILSTVPSCTIAPLSGTHSSLARPMHRLSTIYIVSCIAEGGKTLFCGS